MTALEKYQRLESTGLWRASPDSQRREVLVSLGDATLMISTMQERALSHWSLPAVQRLNPGSTPALYAPGPDADETLEIAEDDMIDAIEKVRDAIDRKRPHPGRLRLLIGSIAAVSVLALAVFWAPGALVRQTAALLPVERRVTLGRQLLAEMESLTGAPCEAQLGRGALRELGQRVFGEGAPRLVVLSSPVAGTLHLPGGVIVLDRGLLEDHETPEVVAGHLLAERLRQEGNDPAERLLRDAGLVPTLRLLTTGEIASEHLHAHAADLLITPPAPVHDEALLARFEAAGISSEPYAYALDITGETTLPLIEADPLRGEARELLLPDQSWIALQEICTASER